jgi:hypothetical protein
LWIDRGRWGFVTETKPLDVVQVAYSNFFWPPFGPFRRTVVDRTKSDNQTTIIFVWFKKIPWLRKTARKNLYPFLLLFEDVKMMQKDQVLVHFCLHTCTVKTNEDPQSVNRTMFFMVPCMKQRQCCCVQRWIKSGYWSNVNRSSSHLLPEGTGSDYG